jgi:hypothetical protein
MRMDSGFNVILTVGQCGVKRLETFFGIEILAARSGLAWGMVATVDNLSSVKCALHIWKSLKLHILVPRCRLVWRRDLVKFPLVLTCRRMQLMQAPEVNHVTAGSL